MPTNNGVVTRLRPSERRAEVSLDPTLLESSRAPKRKRGAGDPNRALDVLIIVVIAVVLVVLRWYR